MKKNISYVNLTGHKKRKLEDMELALNLDRTENNKVKILAIKNKSS